MLHLAPPPTPPYWKERGQSSEAEEVEEEECGGMGSNEVVQIVNNGLCWLKKLAAACHTNKGSLTCTLIDRGRGHIH